MKTCLTWAQRVQRAVNRGRFTPVDERLAGAWPTCAVGEGTTIRDAVELDEQLYDVGLKFYSAVLGNRVGEAQVLFSKIQVLKDAIRGH